MSIKMKALLVFSLSFLLGYSCFCQEKQMNKMWDGGVGADRSDTSRGKIFREGRYAMFIHFGLYARLENRWKGKTYYGIGEWLMHKAMANISVEAYRKVAADFNPVNFNADEIVAMAKSAGMKYVIITSKHHDGFALFHSKFSAFNIYDATPFKRDLMKEMAVACKKAGLGFGFYYSQTQDWSTPGGNNGPEKDEQGKMVTFDEYFNNRCLPEVNQLTTEYGPITLIWFDTPNGINKEYSRKLVDIVHKNQPQAYVSGRVGNGLGDYATLGDMEVPLQNTPGLWETVDVTNDSWGFAWYDKNWKSPKEILTRTLSTIARGGNFMLNVGPRGDGSIPIEAALSLKSSGGWIRKYPQTVYGASRSPWQHALPWGDATVRGRTISLLVYNWPATGRLYLHGLESKIESVVLLIAGKRQVLSYTNKNKWLVINVPYRSPEQWVSVLEVTVKDEPRADATQFLDPQGATELYTEFADTDKSVKKNHSWMEKFGEWKHATVVRQWQPGGKASWKVKVGEPGYYQTYLKYAGEGRLVWKIQTDKGELVQNQQSSSAVYSYYPMGWLHFDKPGEYIISVSPEEGDTGKASLIALMLERVIL